MAKWSVYPEAHGLNQFTYWLDCDDRKVCELTKQQYKVFEQLQSENKYLKEKIINTLEVHTKTIAILEQVTDNLLEKAKQVQTENKRLKEALKLYGGHSQTCGKLPLNAKCICGFEQALEGEVNG